MDNNNLNKKILYSALPFHYCSFDSLDDSPPNVRDREMERQLEAQSERALNVEENYLATERDRTLLVKFPPHRSTANFLKQSDDSIREIVFPGVNYNSYCYAVFETKVKMQEAQIKLNNLMFGGGLLEAEPMPISDIFRLSPDEIDPLTLCVRNLPLNITVQGVSLFFVSSAKIRICRSQTDFSAYAFIKFVDAQTALTEFELKQNFKIGGRKIFISFRRVLPHRSRESSPFEDEAVVGIDYPARRHSYKPPSPVRVVNPFARRFSTDSDKAGPSGLKKSNSRRRTTSGCVIKEEVLPSDHDSDVIFINEDEVDDESEGDIDEMVRNDPFPPVIIVDDDDDTDDGDDGDIMIDE